MSDAYTWAVHYRDGSIIGQIDADGEDVGSWRKVDVRNVAVIQIIPVDTNLPVHGVLVPEGATAFFTFRRVIEQDMNTGEQFHLPALAIAGWEKDGNEAYIFVDHLGNVALAGDRNAIQHGAREG